MISTSVWVSKLHSSSFAHPILQPSNSQKSVPPPDLATIKDFLRFHVAISRGRIDDKRIIGDSVNTIAEWYFAGFARVTGNPINEEDRRAVYNLKGTPLMNMEYVSQGRHTHNAAVAANAVVESYRLISRQNELNQKILTFSISHDHQAVKIYGHYALIKGKETTFYRYLLRHFSITDQDGKDKWTAYRTCSAVDQLPNPEDFAVESFSQQSELGSFGQNDSQLITSYLQETAGTSVISNL